MFLNRCELGIKIECIYITVWNTTVFCIAKMPLYKRRPFEAKPIPQDLKDDEEVYYLKLTNEIFRDYEYVIIKCKFLASNCWKLNLHL